MRYSPSGELGEESAHLIVNGERRLEVCDQLINGM